MPLVSIIIPVYNVEKFLRKCLNSILAQTHTNWEAILVDDGSPDNCGAICDEYAQKDPRFKVIHQKNGGVSVARQAGLDNATGDYTIHCDPDDWIEPNMLEELLQCAINNSADMVICDFIEDNQKSSNYVSQNLPDRISAKEVKAKIIEGRLHCSCVNKLIKRSCLKGIGFTPSTISHGEDELFNIRVLCQDIKVAYLPKAFYHYNRCNNSSICHSTNTNLILSRKIGIKECEKLVDIKEFNNLYEMKKELLSHLFRTNNLDTLKSTYTEIHEEIIKRNSTYNFFTPVGYFLARALKSSPRLYYILYRINLGCIITGQRIKYYIQKAKR